MKPVRIQSAAVFLTFLTAALPAVAQDAPKTVTQEAPDTNQEFLVGLRRVGVMAG